MLTIANLSGGRDSTAMVIRYLELGNDIHNIYMEALLDKVLKEKDTE